MRISHSDFWNMTIQEIMNAYDGHTENTLNEWRRTRWLAHVISKSFGSKHRSPSDLMELPGDSDEHEEGIKRIKAIRDGRK